MPVSKSVFVVNINFVRHPTNIHTDASDIAVGAVLKEFRDNSCVPLAFISGKLEKREKLYPILA